VVSFEMIFLYSILRQRVELQKKFNIFLPTKNNKNNNKTTTKSQRGLGLHKIKSHHADLKINNI